MTALTSTTNNAANGAEETKLQELAGDLQALVRLIESPNILAGQTTDAYFADFVSILDDIKKNITPHSLASLSDDELNKLCDTLVRVDDDNAFSTDAQSIFLHQIASTFPELLTPNRLARIDLDDYEQDAELAAEELSR